MSIKLTIRTVDHIHKSKRYETLAKARAAALVWLGDSYEIGAGYAVSGDGVVTVSASGDADIRTVLAYVAPPTLATLKARAKQWCCDYSVTRRNGEYRLAPVGQPRDITENYAYYTSDPQDALDTLGRIADEQQGESPARPAAPRGEFGHERARRALGAAMGRMVAPPAADAGAV